MFGHSSAIVPKYKRKSKMKKTITLKGGEMSEFAQGLTADRISKMRLTHIEGCMDTDEEEGYIKVHFEIKE